MLSLSLSLYVSRSLSLSLSLALSFSMWQALSLDERNLSSSLEGCLRPSSLTPQEEHLRRNKRHHNSRDGGEKDKREKKYIFFKRLCKNNCHCAPSAFYLTFLFDLCFLQHILNSFPKRLFFTWEKPFCLLRRKTRKLAIVTVTSKVTVDKGIKRRLHRLHAGVLNVTQCN